MTAVLVTASDAKVFMGVTTTGDDTLIQGLVDAGEELFLRQCGRVNRPFLTGTATALTEVLDGTGTRQVMVKYPIGAVTSITLGVDVSNPAETLTPTDVNSVVYTTGQRAIYRTDGGLFQASGPDTTAVAGLTPIREPRVVTVVYNRDADVPDLPKLAIKRLVAAIYRQRGSEEVKSESLPDGYSRTMTEATADPIWQAALESQWEPSLT